MRNYRFFISFLASMMVTIVLFFVNVIVFGVVNKGNGVSQGVIITVCVLVGVCIGIPLIGFLIFHLVLVCKGVTTRELIKDLSNNTEE